MNSAAAAALDSRDDLQPTLAADLSPAPARASSFIKNRHLIFSHSQQIIVFSGVEQFIKSKFALHDEERRSEPKVKARGNFASTVVLWFTHASWSRDRGFDSRFSSFFYIMVLTDLFSVGALGIKIEVLDTFSEKKIRWKPLFARSKIVLQKFW